MAQGSLLATYDSHVPLKAKYPAPGGCFAYWAWRFHVVSGMTRWMVETKADEKIFGFTIIQNLLSINFNFITK